MVCKLEERHGIDSWCHRHQMFHIGHTRELVLDTGDKGQRFRAALDAGVPAPPPPPPKLLRSLPMAKNCIHNQGKNAPIKVGCAQCTTYSCAVKGRVRLEHCAQECRQHVSKPYKLDEPPLENSVPTTEVSTLPINGAWVRDPKVWEKFRKMIEQEIAKHG